VASYDPNVYVLGARPELRLAPVDEDGLFFAPTEMRMSIEQPDGVIVTYSGAELTLASGYYYVMYRPPTIGWYEYEGWVKDSAGREIAQTHGFDVIDRVG
jgi:hypothetical protein